MKGAVCKGLKDVGQKLGFSNHPLPQSGCVRISKTGHPPRTSASGFSYYYFFPVIIFTHF